MITRPRQITSLLLVAVFLVASFGSAFGCVWCDSGCLSETHINNHLDDHSDRHVDRHDDKQVDVHVDVTVRGRTFSLDPHIADDVDSCNDSFILLERGLLEDDELVRKPAPDPENFFSYIKPSQTSHTELFFGNLILDIPPRLTLAILSHRTIVLLS